MNQRLSTPPDAVGALYFLPGQYLFKHFADGCETVKALSGEQIGKAFQDFRTDTGWLGRRLIRYREEPEINFVLSLEPAGIRRIFVETDNGTLQEVKVPLPAFVLLGKGSEYYLWAAIGKGVSAKTKLAVAPLPNIGGEYSGKICFGRNDVPEASCSSIDAVWDLIFNAPFNKDQANGKCRSEKRDVRKLLLALSKSGAKTFPASELIKSDTTIEEIWERITGNNKYQKYQN